MQEKTLVIEAPREIRVFGEGDDYPLCSRRCQWFTLGACNLFECELNRDAADQWPRCRACLRASDADGDVLERYPALRKSSVRYIPLTAAPLHTADINDKYMKGSGVRFWIYALCSAPLPDDTKQPTSLPAKAARVKKNLPKEIARDLSAEEKAAFSKAMEGDAPVWFLKLEDKGWDWSSRNGAKDVAQIQAVLEWIDKFRKQRTVNGAKLLYCEVNNKNV